MVVYYVFEDNDDTPSSELLKLCANGSNIYFSEGHRRFWWKVKQVMKQLHEDDMLIGFFDLPLDNDMAVVMYDRVMRNYMSYIHLFKKNVYIIPIICIEYFIYFVVRHYNYDKYFSLNYPGSGSSEENRYKDILKHVACLSNRSGNTVGFFYKGGCNKCGCCDDRYLRAEQLYSSLPAVGVVSKEHFNYLYKHDIFMVKTTMNEIEKETLVFFNGLAVKLGRNNPFKGLQVY